MTPATALFQFTPLREGRPHFSHWEKIAIEISIHAPAGGATPAPGRAAACWCYFNSRPCGRGDASRWVQTGKSILFQFTPLREGRRRDPAVLQCEAISIHAPAGGATEALYSCVSDTIISIHAPAGGATLGLLLERNEVILFQFTPLREGRRGKLFCGLCGAPIFQFTPLREGRRAACAPADALHHFNSRPCGRGDLPPVHHGQREKRISIHAPAGGATARPENCTITLKFQFTPLREGRQAEKG